MSIQKLTISTLLLSVITACGCISESIQAAGAQAPVGSQVDKKADAKVKEPQIQREWQNKFIELFRKDQSKHKVAIALFSYGGWSNDGQVLIFGDDSKGGTAMYAKPGSKDVDTTKDLTAVEFDSFAANSKKFENLPDVDNGVMDGLEFEFVKAVRDEKGDIKVIQRVFMNNPGVGKPAPLHEELVKLFSEFKAKK
jgi:hypothetical protein